jgi:murein DD-endopeptidase MepM/ murein hydrolase activator NlpD
MAQSDIEKEVQELFRYFGIGGTIQEPEFARIPEATSERGELPGADGIARPSKYEGKWEYHYEKPEWGNYRSPAEGGLISRHHPVSQGGFATSTHPQGHEGYDIANKKGAPIYAIGPGTVKRVYGPENKGGNAVLTEHEDGRLTSYYAHLDSINVNEGDKVNQSTMIGTMGDSGNAKGSVHLHWHIRLDGQPVSPNEVIGKPIGFSKKADGRNTRLTKLARRHRIAVWNRLLLQNL